MKKLIVLRHGDYNAAGDLSPLGKQQMERMAEKIPDLVADCSSIRVFSSPAKRALQSAEVIAAKLGLSAEKDSVFYSADGKSNTQGALGFILSLPAETDGAIIVTHAELASEIPFYYAYQILKLPKMEYRVVSRGCGIILDLEAKTSKLIVP